MQNACTLQEQAPEARAHISRIPRSKHTPQDAIQTELTKAGVAVGDEDSAVIEIVVCHLRDSEYTFYGESMLVPEYPWLHAQLHTRARTHTHLRAYCTRTHGQAPKHAHRRAHTRPRTLR